jgi:putative Mg2+ transporter-C (MgtC) family protein
MVAVIEPSFLTMVLYLAVALLLASLIGLEREYRQKSAGLRTNTLVGLGAALFMVVSKYGFFDVLQPGVSLDPSRVAAQIVTGIGFIGGGIIFVKRSDVRGLTTAAGVWLTAAVGMAAGAGMLAVAAAATAAYYLVAFAYPYLVGALRRSRPTPWLLHLEYIDGRGVLRAALAEASRRGFEIGELNVARDEPVLAWAAQGGASGQARALAGRERHVFIDLELVGKAPPYALVDALDELDGMLAVRTEDTREETR